MTRHPHRLCADMRMYVTDFASNQHGQGDFNARAHWDCRRRACSSGYRDLAEPWSDLVDCCASLGSVVARKERGGIR